MFSVSSTRLLFPLAASMPIKPRHTLFSQQQSLREYTKCYFFWDCMLAKGNVLCTRGLIKGKSKKKWGRRDREIIFLFFFSFFKLLFLRKKSDNIQLKTWLETEVPAQKYSVMTHENNSLVPIASSSLLMVSFHMWTTRIRIKVAFFWEYFHYWQGIR